MSTTASEIQAEIVTRFTELCADADNVVIAAAADRALLALDTELASVAAPANRLPLEEPPGQHSGL